MNLTNWNFILEAYNDKFKTNYYYVETLLKDLYEKTKSTTKMDRILGVAETTIMKKLKNFKVPIQKKGGDYLSRSPKKRTFLNIPNNKLRNMSINEIMESINCSETYVHYLLKQRFDDYPNCYRKREIYKK